MSGGGSRASASALTSGMPLVGGESTMSSSFSPMLASDMDLGMPVALKGVTDITSAAQHNRRLIVHNCESCDWHGSTAQNHKCRALCWHLTLPLQHNKTDFWMGNTFPNGSTVIGSAI